MKPPKTNKLNEWLAFIEQCHPDEIDLGLNRLREVATRLQLSNFHCPVITVSGTNGKGSCIRTMESVYLAGGYQVGTYTSPHLVHFNERVCLNGQPVSDESLVEQFQIIVKASQNTQLTFFEYTTLAALLLFQQCELDVILLEVGLGGRLDAVNIIDADLAIITSIALDHCEWLGDERAVIAREKIGICRENHPVVIGEVDMPLAAMNILSKMGCTVFQYLRDFHTFFKDTGWYWQTSQNKLGPLPKPRFPISNAACALMAIDLLKSKLPVDDKLLIQGVQKVNVPARFQTIDYSGRQILFDVAHNPAACDWLAKQLESHTQYRAIFAALNDKSIDEMLKPLSEMISHWYIPQLMHPRATKVNEIKAQLGSVGCTKVNTYDNVASALQAAISQCEEDDQLIVFGSFVTVGKAIEFLTQT